MQLIPQIETQSLQAIKDYQGNRLVELLNYLKSNSKYYSQLFQKNKIRIENIRTLDDLTSIPTTGKDDLQKRNEDFICVASEKILDYTTTSGTLGEPVTFAMTDGDLNRLAYNESISFACADGSEEDIYQLMTTIDRRFMAGLAYFLGVRKLGAGIIRVGGGLPELQWDTIRKFLPTTCITIPSFLLELIKFAENHDIEIGSSSIKKAICIGEPIRTSNFEINALSKKIKSKWDIKLYSTYASTEMATAFTECGEGIGGHHHPELIITEFLNQNGEHVKEGEIGEVTISTLGVEGMPLLRFRTGDMCAHYTEPCSCGRNTIRLGPVVGRKQQMIKFKGTTLYPSVLFEIMDDVEEVENYVVEVFRNEIGTDEIVMKIGTSKSQSDIEQKLKDRIRTKLRVLPKLKFEPVEVITQLQSSPTNSKKVKFIDKRINGTRF